MQLLLLARFINGAVPLFSMPIFLYFLGQESVGSIQVVALIAGLLVIADFGISPTMTRLAARFQATTSEHWYPCLKISERRIAYIACFIFGLYVYFSESTMLPAAFNADLVKLLHILIAINLALMLLVSLYVATLAGAQDNQTLTVYYLSSAFARLVIVSLFLLLWPTLFTYFIVQIAICVISIVCLRYSISQLASNSLTLIDAQKTLNSEWRFGVSMTAIAAFGTLYTYADRIMLSTQLNLNQFTSYSLAVSLAGSLMLIAMSFFSVYHPKFCAEYRNHGFSKYASEIALEGGVRLSFFLFLPASFVLVFSKEILLAWLQNDQIATEAYLALVFITVGNVLNGLANIPYAAQLAAGRASEALKMNMLLLCFALPGMWLATKVGGLNAAAACWACLNFFIAIVWVKRIMPSDLGISALNWWLLTIRDAAVGAIICIALFLVLRGLFFTQPIGLMLLGALFFAHASIFILVVRPARQLLFRKISESIGRLYK
jgi:O-antigen/teichoic acid export membrane protein